MALRRRVITGKDGRDEKEMGFFDHLEALRWHIIRSLIAVIVLGTYIFLNKEFVFRRIIFAPRYDDFWTYRFMCSLADWLCIKPTPFIVITRDLAEKFTTHITVSFVLGLIVAFPYVFWEFWRFIKPGLYPKEQKAARGIVLVCSLLFIAGVLFGYYMIAPFAMAFLAGYNLPGAESTPTLGSYINYLIMFTLPIGLVFEMPIISFFLTRVGILSPKLLIKARRYAIVIIVILAGILTPSPDVVSQMILATPLYLLYEASIWVSRREQKRKKKIEDQEEAELLGREKLIAEKNEEQEI
jgi:sec-independent protein translocase protein TatC